jgi:hypothetical protein
MSPVEQIYGPTIIGIFLNLILYGIMITQTYFYMTTFKDDKPWMKKLVGFIFLADTLNTVFDATFLYKRLVQSFGDVEAVMVADWVFNSDPAMTCIIAMTVQLFFAWRIKLLTRNMTVFTIIVICSGVQFFAGLATAVACSIITHFVEFQKFQVVVILWLAFSALADVIIAVAMTVHLRNQKTGFAFTDDLIDRITRLTVQTGAITAIFAIIDLITFLVSTSGLHLAFNMPLAKLYTNSLLSTLNSRTRPGTNTSRSLSGGQTSTPRFGGRKEELGVDIPTRTQRHDSKIMIHPQNSHELEEVGVDTKVYINVEEVRNEV